MSWCWGGDQRLLKLVACLISVLRLTNQYPLGKCSEIQWNPLPAFLSIMTLLKAMLISGRRSTHILKQSPACQEGKLLVIILQKSWGRLRVQMLLKADGLAVMHGLAPLNHALSTRSIWGYIPWLLLKRMFNTSQWKFFVLCWLQGMGHILLGIGLSYSQILVE